MSGIRFGAIGTIRPDFGEELISIHPNNNNNNNNNNIKTSKKYQ